MFFAGLMSFLFLLLYVAIIGLGLYIALLVIKALQIYIRNHS